MLSASLGQSRELLKHPTLKVYGASKESKLALSKHGTQAASMTRYSVHAAQISELLQH